jgi:hypothetical protein
MQHMVQAGMQAFPPATFPTNAAPEMQVSVKGSLNESLSSLKSAENVHQQQQQQQQQHNNLHVSRSNSAMLHKFTTKLFFFRPQG